MKVHNQGDQGQSVKYSKDIAYILTPQPSQYLAIFS